ncbi:hypothetical protein ACOMHN_059752 [Nucella lapillus]
MPGDQSLMVIVCGGWTVFGLIAGLLLALLCRRYFLSKTDDAGSRKPEKAEAVHISTEPSPGDRTSRHELNQVHSYARPQSSFGDRNRYIYISLYQDIAVESANDLCLAGQRISEGLQLLQQPQQQQQQQEHQHKQVQQPQQQQQQQQREQGQQEQQKQQQHKQLQQLQELQQQDEQEQQQQQQQQQIQQQGSDENQHQQKQQEQHFELAVDPVHSAHTNPSRHNGFKKTGTPLSLTNENKPSNKAVNNEVSTSDKDCCKGCDSDRSPAEHVRSFRDDHLYLELLTDPPDVSAGAGQACGTVPAIAHSVDETGNADNAQLKARVLVGDGDSLNARVIIVDDDADSLDHRSTVVVVNIAKDNRKMT